MTTKVGPIHDHVAIVVPADVDLDRADLTALHASLTRIAHRSVLNQYGAQRPRRIIIDAVDWLITSDPAEVEPHQPAHDCETCRKGNADICAFLTANPGRLIALGNLTYTELWWS